MPSTILGIKNIITHATSLLPWTLHSRKTDNKQITKLIYNVMPGTDKFLKKLGSCFTQDGQGRPL